MINGLPEGMLDEKTPPEVRVTDEPREPVRDPSLGIEVEVAAEGNPRHRLVAIGDSLTRGFQSGAIYNTDLSYPAIIAYEMGWYEHFRHPSYFGQDGLPLNLELLIRELEQEFGEKLDWWELPLAVFRARQFMARVEDWWERGLGTEVANLRGINHNLAIYGWDLRDTLELTADKLEEQIKEPKDHLFWQIVKNANERATLRVLRAARDENGRGTLTPFGAAAALGAEGTIQTPNQGDGIETLIVLLGANNALPSILNLNVVWSKDSFDDLEEKKKFTVWNPAHFQTEFDEVVERVKEIRARHVIWGTVPRVTIAPIARGVGLKIRRGSRYYPYYTRPWIRDEDFDAKNDPHITEQEARAIDSAIDQYNAHITEDRPQSPKRGPGLVPARRRGHTGSPGGAPLHRRPAREAQVVEQVRATRRARGPLAAAGLPLLTVRSPRTHGRRPILARWGPPDYRRLRHPRLGDHQHNAATRGRRVPLR